MRKDIALITPSYDVDFEACRLLVDSVKRHVPNDIVHYLIIPRSDYSQFKILESERCILKFQEDFLPWWIIPSGISKKWYFSFKTLPVRGWIRQQIVKAATAKFLDEECFLIMDSDTFFVDDFKFEDFVKEGSVSFYCESLAEAIPAHEQWQMNSCKMFKLSSAALLKEIYVGPFIFWKRDVLNKMFDVLEVVNGCSWEKTMARQLSVSEYTIYGVFVRQVIGLKTAGHFVDPVKYTHDYYEEIPLSREELIEFKAKRQAHQIGVSISSKSFTSIDLIREVFGY